MRERTAALLLFIMSANSQVTLRSVTRLVQITVVAQDSKGQPVTDLTRDDFLLFDGGHQGEIKVFTIDRNSRQRAPISVATAANPAEHIYTNSTVERSGPGAVTIILLDSLNTKWTDQAQAARSVIRFLSQVQPDDHIAIYSIGLTGFRVLHDFTTDASDLVARLASWKGEIPRTESTDLGDQLASVLSGRDSSSVLNQRRAPVAMSVNSHHTVSTTRTMSQLASRLTGIPGRKNVIWISNGFSVVEWGNLAVAVLSPANDTRMAAYSRNPSQGGSAGDDIGDSGQYSREVDRAVRLLDAANVSLYPIEARGLQTYTPEIAGAPRKPGRIEFGTTVSSLGDQATQQAMYDVARKTGGRAFTLTNDLVGAIGTAIDDTRVTYTLGFYPESTLQDGQFHPITIKLAERRGITLRYRQGYIDARDTPADPGRRKYDLEQAALSPIDANALPLTARMLPSGHGAYNLNLTMSVSSLNLHLDGEVWSGDVDIFLVERDHQGHEFNHVNETIVMRLKQTTYEQMIKTGALYRRQIVLNSKADMLRVVVRDARSADLGSLTIPIKELAR